MTVTDLTDLRSMGAESHPVIFGSSPLRYIERENYHTVPIGGTITAPLFFSLQR